MNTRRRPFLGFGRDMRLAARRLLATPLFLSFAVLSIAIGIATTTAAYSMLESFLWKPSGIADPHGVGLVTTGGGSARAQWRRALSQPDFDDLAARQQSFSDLAAVLETMQTIATPTASEFTTFEAVTGDFFKTVRVDASLGRMLQPADDAARAQVVVLGNRIWRLRFGADAAIVGKAVNIGGRPFEIVGVALQAYGGVQGSPVPVAGWLPLSTAAAIAQSPPASPVVNPRDRQQLIVIGRLAPGRSLAAAAAELAAIGQALDGEAPVHTFAARDGSRPVIPRRWSARSIETRDGDGGEGRVGALIIAIVALVLVVACTNLGNLTLSRGARRRQELAVRGALGASRWRLVREMLAETVIVGVIAAACTIPLTQALLAAAAQEISTPLGTFLLEPELNLRTAALASAALLLSMMVFGLEPALALTRRGAQLTLASETAAADTARPRRQRAFVRWQVAISACFFLVAAILIKALAAQAMHDSGIALEEIATVSAHVPLQNASDPRVRRSLDRAAAVARQNDLFTSVAVASGMPFGLPWTPWAAITLPGELPKSGQERTDARMIAASPEIFRTLGIPIAIGRQFDDRDAAAAARVIVLSEKTAKTLFGTRNAIGRQVTLEEWGRFPKITFSVIGIARDTDSGRLMSRRDDVVYVPLAETRSPNFLLVGRTSGDPSRAARVLQNVLRSIDPDLGTGVAGPAFWLVAGPYAAARIGATLAGALGALTLILAMIGLYGVQAQAIAYRTRELGVRMALGAESAQIERMVLREGSRPVLEGLILGLIFGALARGVIRSILVAPIQIVDPISFAMVPLPLFAAAFLACYLPARRAARVDPNVALRHL